MRARGLRWTPRRLAAQPRSQRRLYFCQIFGGYCAQSGCRLRSVSFPLDDRVCAHSFFWATSFVVITQSIVTRSHTPHTMADEEITLPRGVKDVPAELFIKAYAQHLKQNDKVQQL